MPLERSVLDKEKMELILKNEYGLSFIDHKRIDKCSANCYKVRCAEGNFFFKEYQSDITKDMVDKEAKVVTYLSGRNFPVASFLKTKNGYCQIIYDGHVISIQNYIEGKTYLNDLPHPLMLRSAAYLGKLHALLKGYPMETDMDHAWASSFSSDKIRRKFDALLSSAEEKRSDANYKRIKDDLIFKKELMRSLDEWKEFFTGITYTPSHGDYTACQLICGEDDIKAVTDFSCLRCIPAVWEIMRSYIQSGGIDRSGSDLDIEDLTSYVKEYMKYAPLTKRDLEAMPYIYLFQLAQSTYGYKQYLVLETENKNDLLDFAFWRTDILRQIYSKASDISFALTLNANSF